MSCTRLLARSIGCGAACALGFAAVSTALGALAPFPEVPGVSPKLKHLARSRAAYDVVCVGSSRVLSQFIPEVFDRVTGLRSFNAGVAGMVAPESIYFARQILALHQSRLKWMLIELTDFNPLNDDRNADTSRAVYWHDARETALVCRELWSGSMRWPEKLAQTATHGRYFARRSANIGRGAALLDARLRASRKAKRIEDVADGGFVAIRSNATASDRDRIAASFAELRSRKWPAVPLRASYRAALLSLVADARAGGVEPIFFVAPGFNWQTRFASPSADVRLLTFYDETRSAALFDAANYADTVHLNPTGAEIFSRALAGQFSATR